jgi:hypothetical protein
MINVTISSDPLTLGAAATQSDLDRYRTALESLLSRDMGREVRVALGLATQCDDEQCLERVRQIESGGEWTRLLD